MGGAVVLGVCMVRLLHRKLCASSASPASSRLSELRGVGACVRVWCRSAGLPLPPSCERQRTQRQRRGKSPRPSEYEAPFPINSGRFSRRAREGSTGPGTGASSADYAVPGASARELPSKKPLKSSRKRKNLNSSTLQGSQARTPHGEAKLTRAASGVPNEQQG